MAVKMAVKIPDGVSAGLARLAASKIPEIEDLMERLDEFQPPSDASKLSELESLIKPSGASAGKLGASFEPKPFGREGGGSGLSEDKAGLSKGKTGLSGGKPGLLEDESGLWKDKPGLWEDKPSFSEALLKGRASRSIGVIAEYKRASPSLGDIDLATPPEKAAEDFQEADCLSVLTEADYFKGDIGYLERVEAFKGPVLRKDFIFHPLQIMATAQTRASAILLIVGLAPGPALLPELIRLAEDAGLEAVAEIFTLDELEAARRAKAKIIQVNARNLGDLSLDPARSLSLIKSAKPLPGEAWIAASGMRTRDDLKRAAEFGYHGVLVGTALMRASNKRAALRGLMDG